MRLPKPFYRLPVRFDAARLREEVGALPAAAWAAHPGKIEGNSSVRLISVAGGETDDVNGVMLPTQHLQRCPYVRQILASFGVVWSRSRFMRLAPHSSVPEHADINYHWFNRVRLHIPVITRPEVRFHCGDQSVHMAAGEAWLFDNWRLHRVENPCADERIHLVADTTGTSRFWQLAAQADSASEVRDLPYDPARNAEPMTERTPPPVVMPPAEVELQAMDLRSEIALRTDAAEGRGRLARYHGMLDAFCRDWRQIYLLHGDRPSGWPEYARLREAIRTASRHLAEGIAARTNGVDIHTVLEGRLLRHVLTASDRDVAPVSSPGISTPAAARPEMRSALKQPIFIVAAPRSGSTLLFETLAASRNLTTLGGEAHWLIEGMPQLRPGAPGVDSNRLTAAHASPDVASQVVSGALGHLRNADGQPVTAGDGIRLLEKTPKNALRIPFLDAIFPDARFVFLWRDPRENLSSIIEAWRSGDWITYRELAGWDGSWSLLLPPGWQALRGRPLEEVAAHQWEVANRTVLEDLAALARDRWCTLSYHDFLADAAGQVRRICAHMQIEFDAGLQARVAGPLPHSRYTHTPPDPGKWRRNEALVLRVLAGVTPIWERLKALR